MITNLKIDVVPILKSIYMLIHVYSMYMAWCSKSFFFALYWIFFIMHMIWSRRTFLLKHVLLWFLGFNFYFVTTWRWIFKNANRHIIVGHCYIMNMLIGFTNFYILAMIWTHTKFIEGAHPIIKVCWVLIYSL